jgi:uncharacterized protein
MDWSLCLGVYPETGMSDKTIICPVCGKETTWESEPRGLFCSERCKLIDLGKWAGGEYKVPGESAGPEEMEKETERGSEDKSGRVMH